MSAYGRTAASSVTVLLTSEGAFDEFKQALTTNPTLSVSVERENDYYLRQSKNATTFFGFVATFVGGIMALGALFAALNTMYSAVSTRVVEIATLRAIGFGATGVVVSVLVESLALALLGAVIGAGVAWALFGGNTISLGNTHRVARVPDAGHAGAARRRHRVGVRRRLDRRPVPGAARRAAAGRDRAARGLIIRRGALLRGLRGFLRPMRRLACARRRER